MSEREKYHDIRINGDQRWCTRCGIDGPAWLTPCDGPSTPPPKEQAAECDCVAVNTAGETHQRHCAVVRESVAPQAAESKAPDGLPENWRTLWKEVHDAKDRLWIDALSGLPAATKRAEELAGIVKSQHHERNAQHARNHELIAERDAAIARVKELEHVLEQDEHAEAAFDALEERMSKAERGLSPNPRCAHGFHPLACADRTDPEGRCLWCEDLKHSAWLKEQLDAATNGHTCPRSEAVEARAETAEAKLKELEAGYLGGARFSGDNPDARYKFLRARHYSMSVGDLRQELDVAISRVEKSERERDEALAKLTLSQAGREGADSLLLDVQHDCVRLHAENARLRDALTIARDCLESDGCDCGTDMPGTCGLCVANYALDEGKEGA